MEKQTICVSERNNAVSMQILLALAPHQSFKVRKKAKIRNRYNQVPQLTQDTVKESDKNTKKYHIQESQEVSPFPTGDL